MGTDDFNVMQNVPEGVWPNKGPERPIEEDRFTLPDANSGPGSNNFFLFFVNAEICDRLRESPWYKYFKKEKVELEAQLIQAFGELDQEEEGYEKHRAKIFADNKKKLYEAYLLMLGFLNDPKNDEEVLKYYVDNNIPQEYWPSSRNDAIFE